ncbi:hypothetical protein PROFUN_01248 [Planoprotostelium fungivorum]|uniref:Uncharacterized protein n=1 Tax=Planoprotostelium fungivorum TaxID=1890364 RepID=A0A2P6NZI4_9EUKA|nr:hypothetical protein PROFUN_01248 [Planoprotostelium fungivorum]
MEDTDLDVDRVRPTWIDTTTPTSHDISFEMNNESPDRRQQQSEGETTWMDFIINSLPLSHTYWDTEETSFVERRASLRSSSGIIQSPILNQSANY